VVASTAPSSDPYIWSVLQNPEIVVSVMRMRIALI
jgi:hypothetical protein